MNLFSFILLCVLGITGLPVIPHARNVLIALYNKTLEEVKVRLKSGKVPLIGLALAVLLYYSPNCSLYSQVLPEKNHYRKAVESITKFRLAVVMENECVSAKNVLFFVPCDTRLHSQLWRLQAFCVSIVDILTS
jgi:hypothetical protein